MGKRLLFSCIAACATLLGHAQPRINDSLVRVLGTVAVDDERYRDLLEDTIHRYGAESS